MVFIHIDHLIVWEGKILNTNDGDPSHKFYSAAAREKVSSAYNVSLSVLVQNIE